MPALVTIGGVSQPIPGSFLGLSVEVGELASYVRGGAAFDRVLSLLRPVAGDPMLLRVAGNSAEAASWNTPVRGASPLRFALGDRWLGNLASLARRDRLRVTLGLNLALHSPAEAASFARAAWDALGPSALAGFAVGNEPDLFPYQPWLARMRIATTLASTTPQWPRDYSPARYRSDYEAYARAVKSAVPGVRLDGPETTEPARPWLNFFRGLGPVTPQSLTVHRYPSSKCWAKSSPAYPRISLLLNERASEGLARGLASAIALAHKAHLSFVVSEMNSVSCGGNQGVADAFATALWAPDALFELARAGVDGVNWHVRARLINAPFELVGGDIQPLPELYGLVLFARMLGPDTRLIQARVRTSRGAHLKVWITRTGRRLNVLLINKGYRPILVSLPARATGPAKVELIWAPSISSRDRVSVGGRVIGADGRWHGREQAVTVHPRRGHYRVLVSGYSAAYVQEVQP